MSHPLIGLPLVAGVFVGMLVMLETGRRVGRRRLMLDPAGATAGLGAVDGAVFGLMGLLIAFTFSGAASRFDARRHLIVAEANDIGTAYLRLDLLPPATQPALRAQFRQYVDTRLVVYRAGSDSQTVAGALARAAALRRDIWGAAVTAGRDVPQATLLLLPALNAMFDVTTERAVAAQTHPPPLIFALLGFLALACALLAGHGMAASATRSWIHVVGFAAILALTVYVIVDLEYPRLGFIRIDQYDQVLADVRMMMAAGNP